MFEQSAKLLRLYDAALARAEAAERDAERMKDEYFGGRTYDYESSERRAEVAKSRLAEATALLATAASRVDWQGWHDDYQAFLAAERKAGGS